MGRYAQARRRGNGAIHTAPVLPIPVAGSEDPDTIFWLQNITPEPALARIEVSDDGVNFTTFSQEAWENGITGPLISVFGRVVGTDGSDIPVTQPSNIVEIVH